MKGMAGRSKGRRREQLQLATGITRTSGERTYCNYKRGSSGRDACAACIFRAMINKYKITKKT